MGLFSSKKKKHDDYQAYLNYEQEGNDRLNHQPSSNNQVDCFDRSIYSEDSELYHEFVNRAEAMDDSQPYPNYYEEVTSQFDSQNDFDMTNEMDAEGDGVYKAFNEQSVDKDQASSLEDYHHQSMGEDISSIRKRAKYSAKIDRFLNNGIIIVGVLLVLVLLIAFLA
ncbi:hypothetical protein ACQV2R_03880 [Facklamia sp. P12937]|uniref:hypothetical protein n=1 Tax=Facklamia sp. P12937 TaxID=3421949 RepID=UPI003D185A9A